MDNMQTTFLIKEEIKTIEVIELDDKDNCNKCANCSCKNHPSKEKKEEINSEYNSSI